MAFKPIFLRADNNYDMDAATLASGLACPEATLTQQHPKDECDINTIVDRFLRTGVMPENVRMPTYGDFTQVIDFQGALNAIISAENSFMEMPASVRARFANDPGAFVAFCSDPENRAEAIKLGLVLPPPTPTPSASPSPVSGAPSPIPVSGGASPA